MGFTFSSLMERIISFTSESNPLGTAERSCPFSVLEGEGGALVHGGVLAGGGPHPPQCAHWGTFPLGEGSVDAVQLCRVVPPEKAFPGGEGGREADG